MSAVDVCVIGHVVCDRNVIGGVERAPAPGGAAYYASMVHLRLGLRTLVVTSVAGADEDLLLGELRAHGAEIVNLPTPTSTVFRNIDAPDRPSGRRQRVDRLAEPIRAADVPAVAASIWQLGPLTDRDMGPEMTAACVGRGGLVAIDVQGLTRALGDGEVQPRRPDLGAAYVRGTHVLKADEDEILTFAGGDRIAGDVAAAAESVRRQGVREVLITRADRGSTIFAPTGPIPIKAVPPREDVDATGCGDTYLAAYLARRIETADLRECGDFASTVAGLKIEGFGPFRGTRDDVAARRRTLVGG